MWPSVLKLDISGVPEAWINVEEAAHYYATDSVAYSYGDVCARLHGGFSRLTLRRSFIDVHPILAVRGQCAAGKLLKAQPRLTRFNNKLFARDRFTCAYCGGVFAPTELEREHILPCSRGGRDTWMNVVASCRPCNQRKADRTPEEARMPLLYVPYVPSRWEDLILQARRGHVLGDQMEFLRAGLPAHSRLMGQLQLA
ncbi:MAG TPA: HNH endonuclease [Burkholderiaceae bacterium]|nr:HNH endonuclease [Burkholderiaceae bacterium]